MNIERSRRALMAGGASMLAVGLAGCLGTTPAEQWDSDVTLAVSDAHQFSAPGCSCCEKYASYFQEHLDTRLAASVPDDITVAKDQNGIPEELQSFHTLVLDDYVVEGHVPVEVIAKLIDENGAIDGVALPGMPAGSPGMGGVKDGSFTFFVIGGGRTGEVYAQL